MGICILQEGHKEGDDEEIDLPKNQGETAKSITIKNVRFEFTVFKFRNQKVLNPHKPVGTVSTVFSNNNNNAQIFISWYMIKCA